MAGFAPGSELSGTYSKNDSGKGSESAFLGPKEPSVMGLERWLNA